MFKLKAAGRTLVILGLGLVGLFARADLVDYPKEYVALFKQMAQSFGPVVARDEMPDLYELLDRYFKPLSEAQRRLMGARGQSQVVLHDIFVLRSSVINAFVNPISERGINKSLQPVFITTGLLESLFDINKLVVTRDEVARAEMLDLGTKRLIGILAHELGHPLDDVDPSGMKREFGSGISGQAREVKAHSDAIRICQEAGLSSEAILTALELLQKLEQVKIQTKNNLQLNVNGGGTPFIFESKFGSLFSDHPEHELALAAVRGLLVYERYGQGRVGRPFKASVPNGVAVELNAQRRKRPQTELEARDSLLQLIQKNIGSIDDIGINRLSALRDFLDSRGFNIALLEWLLFLRNDLSPPLTSEIVATLKEVLPVLYAFKLWDHEHIIEELLSSEPLLYFDLNGRDASALIAETALFSGSELVQFFDSYTSESPLRWYHLNTWVPNSKVAQEEIKAEVKLDLTMRLQNLFKDSEAANHGLKDSNKLDTQTDIWKWESKRHSTFTIQNIAKSNLYDEMVAQLWLSGYHKIFASSELKFSESMVKAKYIFNSADYLSFLTRNGKKLPVEIEEKILYARPYLIYLTLFDCQLESVDFFYKLFGFDRIDPAELRNAFLNLMAVIEPIDLQNFGVAHTVSSAQIPKWLNQETLNKAYLILDTRNPSRFDKDMNALLNLLTRMDLNYYLKFSLAKTRLSPLKIEEFEQKAQDLLGKAELKERMFNLFEDSLRKGGLQASDSHRLDSLFVRSEVLPIHLRLRAIESAQIEAQDKVNTILQIYNSPHFLDSLNELTQIVYKDNPDQAQKATLQAISLLKRYVPEASLIKKLGELALPVKDLERKQSRFVIWITPPGMSDGNTNTLANTVPVLIRELKSEKSQSLSGLPRAEQLLASARQIFKGIDSARGTALNKSQTNAIEDLLAFFTNEAGSLALTLEQRLELTSLLSRAGSSLSVDSYFEAAVLPLLETTGFNENERTLLMKILSARGISSQNLHLRAAKVILSADISQAELAARSGTVSERAVVLLTDKIEQLIPFGSVAKDNYLEDIAWRLHISEPAILNYLESMKSVNIGKLHPTLVNMASLFSALSQKLSYNENFELLHFLLQGKKAKLPAFLARELEVLPESLNQWTKPKLLRALNDMSLLEYIPLFEFVLMQPKFNVQQNEVLAKRIVSRLLGFAPDSKEGTWLWAYLESIPSHMRAAHIAYYLAQKMDPSGNVERSKFEIFGSMGIVAGQMAATMGWIQDASQDLKDNATPPSKFFVMNQLKTTLSAEEFARISRPVAILGSASVSTAVELELKDGRHIVALIQRPNAVEQVQGNAQIMRRFVDNMFKRDPSFPRTAALMFIDIAEKQILEELDYLKTVRKITAAREFYGRMNQLMKAQLGSFRFYVPDTVKDFQARPSLLMVEKIEGETFDRLPQGPERVLVGECIAHSALQSFFFESWFNEDQHVRNFKIDLRAHHINVFDFGKSSFAERKKPWQGDAQFSFAKVLKAISENEPSSAVAEALSMSVATNMTVPNVDSVTRGVMTSEISPIFSAKKPVADKIVALREVFEKRGVLFPDAFYLARLKGLMLIEREKFIPTARFENAIHDFVARAYLAKLPLLIGERTQSACEKLLKH